MIDESTIRALRLERQGLTLPAATPEAYESLFRLLSPGRPPYFSEPGSAPVLTHRASFPDQALTFAWRGEHRLIKGRFQGGTVGYVFEDELPLFMAAYNKPLPQPNAMQRHLLDLIALHDGLTPRRLRELSGYMNKEIMPQLHRMQEAWLVFEDQKDDDWAREWHVFSSSFPDLDPLQYTREEAIQALLRRYLHLMVISGEDGMVSWLRLPTKVVKAALQGLVASGEVVRLSQEKLEGWMLRVDAERLADLPETPVPRCVFALHHADFMVRAHAPLLAFLFADQKVLQYILVDGLFAGIAVGKWGINPYDVDDIVLLLPPEDCDARREEILAAVRLVLPEPHHHILRYNGMPIGKPQ